MPREVRTTDTKWYLDMAKAIGRRAHAENMVERWQEKVNAAEADINTLQSQLNADAAPEPTQDAEPAQVQE